MAEFLPDIDIAVSVPPREFLEQMAGIGEASGKFVVERHYDALNQAGFDVLNFRYLEPNQHTDLGGQLIARPDVAGRVLVEMRAQWWDPDPPTRVTYCDAVTLLMRPLLRSYNLAHSTRYRFRIARVGAKQPKLTARTKTLFERFALLANTSSLHTLDWDRFYDFVRECRQELPEPVVRAHLTKAGFPIEKAERIAEIHTHLWAFKRRKW